MVRLHRLGGKAQIKWASESEGNLGVFMDKQHSTSRFAFLAFPILVLLGYGVFIVTTYWPYLDWHLRLRSSDLAGLPEDVIGYGFWMWWPFAALLLVVSLGLALWGIQRRLYVAASFLSVFAVLSIGDYLLCKRLVQELTRPM